MEHVLAIPTDPAKWLAPSFVLAHAIDVVSLTLRMSIRCLGGSYESNHAPRKT